MNIPGVDDSISIYIIATKKMVELVSECLESEQTVSVVGSCHYGQNPNLPAASNAIVVFEYDSAQKVLADYFVSSLKEAQVAFISICCDLTEGFKLLNQGALEMVPLPIFPSDQTAKRIFTQSLMQKIRSSIRARSSHVRILKDTIDKPINRIIAIGSSTGGTEAVYQVLKKMPANSPPILIVQHMPPVFTRMYAERLNRTCAISVWEAKDGDVLTPGLALLASGDKHMELIKKGNEYRVKCFSGEKVSGHCPSVDVLFHSVAKVAPDISIGVILTGMGADGAKGLFEMHKRGAFTIGQNEESCIVYGMPRVAFELGAVDVQVALENIANTITSHDIC